MANTTNTKNTCKTCGHCDHGFCRKTNSMRLGVSYACSEYKTPEQILAEAEERKQARLRKEEQRLNFILTGLYIQSTAAMQLLEYFDAQFENRKVESDWRFARKQAANEITKAVQKIRNIYQHSFMDDQNKVMTGHGTREYDVQAYDCHEEDARRWNLNLLHHMEGCWQDDEQEANVLSFYEGLPHIGIFESRDFRHFTTKR